MPVACPLRFWFALLRHFLDVAGICNYRILDDIWVSRVVPLTASHLIPGRGRTRLASLDRAPVLISLRPK